MTFFVAYGIFAALLPILGYGPAAAIFWGLMVLGAAHQQ